MTLNIEATRIAAGAVAALSYTMLVINNLGRHKREERKGVNHLCSRRKDRTLNKAEGNEPGNESSEHLEEDVGWW